MTINSSLPEFLRVNKSPHTGVIKQEPSDFVVNEKLGYDPVGHGEHAFILIQKTSETTPRIAKQLARHADVNLRQVSYAGLKDKHGVTSQWFSVQLPGKPSPDWTELNSDYIQVLQSTRHDRKLKRGHIRSNFFSITVRDFSGDESDLNKFIERVNQYGVPNYFTEQRFGIEGNNLDKALALLDGEPVRIKNARARKEQEAQRGLYISAARSLLFNCVLSKRVEREDWNKAIEGDLFIKTGRHGMFSVDTIDDEIKSRLSDQEISPTGPLYGLGSDMSASGEALQIEIDTMQGYEDYQKLLEHLKVQADRRALRLSVNNLKVNCLSSGEVRLEFELQSGSYATAVLRELIQYPGGMK